NPITGLFALRGETYGEWRSGARGAGLRTFASVPVAGLSAGVDWRATNGALDPIFSFQTAIRRGGLIGGGSMLRLDWLPTRSEVGLGVSIPLRQPFAGRTRPRSIVGSGKTEAGRESDGDEVVAATSVPEAAEHALRA